MALELGELKLSGTRETTIEHQKAVADKILAILQQVDPNAIVAGGAPCDWYFGKTAKDIDVYFDSTEYSHQDISNMIAVAFNDSPNVKYGENIPEGYTGNPSLQYVMDLCVEGEAVQLMGISGCVLEEAVFKFPVSISQIWYKNGVIVPGLLFDIGCIYAMIFRTGEEYCSKKPYMQKIKDKFPSWRHVGF